VPHEYFTKHLVGVIKKTPWKHDEKLRKLEPWNRWLKNKAWQRQIRAKQAGWERQKEFQNANSQEHWTATTPDEQTRLTKGMNKNTSRTEGGTSDRVEICHTTDNIGKLDLVAGRKNWSWS
jgi:hypothetical protein